MDEVTIRELRNNGGSIVDRVESGGQRLTVTRAGRPVAELRPLPRRGVSATTLLRRWKNLPAIDLEEFRRDLDDVLDPGL